MGISKFINPLPEFISFTAKLFEHKSDIDKLFLIKYFI